MRSTLICTVGTSLFGNLRGPDPKDAERPLFEAHRRADWNRLSSLLAKIDPAHRLCGAEINSVDDLVSKGLVARGGLHLLVSDTSDGADVGAVLDGYFRARGWRTSVHAIDGLKDDDPRAFRTRGLRNLAKAIGRRVREYGAGQCAINATGGYKAQIAIAALMGQALDIPVYYKHERFNAIIPFPPMPVALDSSLWERASGMFMALGETNDVAPRADFAADWDARYRAAGQPRDGGWRRVPGAFGNGPDLPRDLPHEVPAVEGGPPAPRGGAVGEASTNVERPWMEARTRADLEAPAANC